MADVAPTDPVDPEEFYEQAPCALFSTLPDGTIVRANHTLLDWLGESRDRRGNCTRFQACLTVGARIYYETHCLPLLQMQGAFAEVALEIKRPDGTVRPVVANARLVRNADGTERARHFALFDSSDRQRYERELLRGRTVAEKQAEDLTELDRQKSAFIAVLAHELRNPLSPLRSAVDVIRHFEHLDPTLAATTAMMQRQVRQMSRLVEDLLDASRLGQDKLAITCVPIDLASVVFYAVETSEDVFTRSGVALSTSLPAAPIYVRADAPRLAQAVGNLLNNAAKFTPAGGSTVLSLEAQGGEAVIRVRDSGIGIAPEKLAHVFRLFMQVDVSLERRGGLGIGLTLARSLVERHNGRITVTSEGLGTGSEFAIRLPALAEPLEGVPRAFAPAVPESRPASKRVLVVDDNHDSAHLVGMLLGFLGHEVRLAHDGLVAVDRAREFRPQVVLLDIGLPRLNGYEVAARILQEPGDRPVLVALTGWGETDDRRKSAAAGFDFHLVKPVDHDELMAIITKPPRGA